MADIKFSLDEEVFFRNTLAHLRVIHDVILKTQDVITDDISPDSDDILANRQLLSISSAYFKDLLSGVSMDVNEVVIKGVTHGMLAKVVEVTHTGATEFRDKKEAVEFMEIAKRLDIFYKPTKSIKALKALSNPDDLMGDDDEDMGKNDDDDDIEDIFGDPEDDMKGGEEDPSEAATQMMSSTPIIDPSEAATQLVRPFVNDPSEAATQLVKGDDITEADTDINEDSEAEEDEEDIIETNKLFKQISKTISKGFETPKPKKTIRKRKAKGCKGKKKRAAVAKSTVSEHDTSKDSGLAEDDDSDHDAKSVDAPSVASTAISMSTPIHARRLSGTCGDFWQCIKCKFYCYSDSDIRRHEVKSHSFAKDDEIPIASEWKKMVKTYEKQNRGYKIRARVLRKRGICGEFFQCHKCDFWNYNREGIRKHQEKVRH